MPMKKRIIYMDDETWERIRELSDGQHITMSEVVRRALLPPFNHVVTPVEAQTPLDDEAAAVVWTPAPHDVWESVPGKMPSDHTVAAPQSFTRFNPVPKVSGRPRRK